MAYGSSGVPEFLALACQRLPTPAIILRTGSLTPPGAETARLEGHSRSLTALCQLADGRLASGSYDKTIRLWDVQTGSCHEITRLEVDAPVAASPASDRSQSAVH